MKVCICWWCSSFARWRRCSQWPPAACTPTTSGDSSRDRAYRGWRTCWLALLDTGGCGIAVLFHAHNITKCVLFLCHFYKIVFIIIAKHFRHTNGFVMVTRHVYFDARAYVVIYVLKYYYLCCFRLTITLTQHIAAEPHLYKISLVPTATRYV